jgi:hypothetical protein
MYLRKLQRAGKIQGLRKHVLYKFKKGAYEADFVYLEGGVLIAEDVKHPALFRGKKFVTNVMKMRTEYNIDVFAIKPSKVGLPRAQATYVTNYSKGDQFCNKTLSPL